MNRAQVRSQSIAQETRQKPAIGHGPMDIWVGVGMRMPAGLLVSASKGGGTSTRAQSRQQSFWPKPIELVMIELITQPQLARGTSTGESPVEMHCRVQVPSVRTGGLMTLGHTSHQLVRTTLRASRRSSGAPEGDEPASG